MRKGYSDFKTTRINNDINNYNYSYCNTVLGCTQNFSHLNYPEKYTMKVA